MPLPLSDVAHIPDADRFELSVNGHTAYLEYIQTRVNFVISHTEVPKEAEGNGAGSTLVEAALAYAQEADLPVIPICSFARAYIENRKRKASEA